MPLGPGLAAVAEVKLGGVGEVRRPNFELAVVAERLVERTCHPACSQQRHRPATATTQMSLSGGFP